MKSTGLDRIGFILFFRPDCRTARGCKVKKVKLFRHYAGQGLEYFGGIDYFKHQANVAQVVEQLTRNEQACGSSPHIGSSNIKALGVFPQELFLFV